MAGNLSAIRSNPGFVYAAQSVFGQLDRDRNRQVHTTELRQLLVALGYVDNQFRTNIRLQGAIEWPLEKLQQFLYQLGRDMFDLMRSTISPSVGWSVLRINDVKAFAQQLTGQETALADCLQTLFANSSECTEDRFVAWLAGVISDNLVQNNIPNQRRQQGAAKRVFALQALFRLFGPAPNKMEHALQTDLDRVRTNPGFNVRPQQLTRDPSFGDRFAAAPQPARGLGREPSFGRQTGGFAAVNRQRPLGRNPSFGSKFAQW